MGSDIAIWLDAPPAQATAAFSKAQALFAAYEQTCSRFRPDSELSRLNARSGDWVTLSDLLWDVLRQALGMAALTNGRFDPTLLYGLWRTGYTDNFEQVAGGLGHSRWSPGWSRTGRWAEVQLDEARQAVRLPLGVGVDLGGIAKGYTAQAAMARLRTIGPCLVDAGGDLVAGPPPTGQPGWPVGIANPGSGPTNLATIWLAEAALATSGIDYRHWLQNGRAVHHLLDPDSGQPANTDGLTVTVLAADAAQAEAWATATLVTGSAGMAALAALTMAGLMVTQDGRILVTPAMDATLMGGGQPVTGSSKYQ